MQATATTTTTAIATAIRNELGDSGDWLPTRCAMFMVSMSSTLCYVSNKLIVLDANGLCKNIYKIGLWELSG